MVKGWSNEELIASVEAYRRLAQQRETEFGQTKKQVYEELAIRFGRTAKAFEYRMQNISAVLDELNLPWIPGLKPAKNVGSAMKAKLIQYVQDTEFMNATAIDDLEGRLEWEKVLAAVTQLGGNASRRQVEDWIRSRDPGYNKRIWQTYI